VADGSHRVLFFPSACASIQFNCPATVVYGQVDFISGVSGVTATMLSEPFGLTVDKDGHLYISDFASNRMLVNMPPEK
jgi:hypothetical protein